MQGQVKIGREFFSKIKLDYADWRWALVREFLQNSFDAPSSTEVTVTAQLDGEHTVLKVANNGAPMDRETLTGKLLTLGGSGSPRASSTTATRSTPSGPATSSSRGKERATRSPRMEPTSVGRRALSGSRATRSRPLPTWWPGSPSSLSGVGS